MSKKRKILTISVCLPTEEKKSFPFFFFCGVALGMEKTVQIWLQSFPNRIFPHSEKNKVPVNIYVERFFFCFVCTRKFLSRRKPGRFSRYDTRQIVKPRFQVQLESLNLKFAFRRVSLSKTENRINYNVCLNVVLGKLC